MSPSARSQRAPPIATDLESLLAIEERIDRTLADARARAARLIDDAQARADRAGRDLTDEIDLERKTLCTAAAARTGADIEKLERAAAAQLARYRAIEGERLGPVAERVCELIARALVGEEEP